jgi:hypothetical protein
MLWRNGCDERVLRCGAGERHQQEDGGGTGCCNDKHATRYDLNWELWYVLGTVCCYKARSVVDTGY